MAPNELAAEATVQLSQVTGLANLWQLDLSSVRMDAIVAAAYLSGTAPQPESIMLDHSHSDAADKFQLHKSSRLTLFGMTSQQGHSDLAISVKSAEAQHAQASAQQARAQHEQTAAVTAHLGRPEYRQLNTFTLTAKCLHVRSAAQLIAASWRNLIKLDFSGTILGAKAAAKLIKGSWPQLKSLCLSSCNLNTDSMAQLATGAWPGLTQLNMSQNPGLIFAESQIAILADWPSLLDLDLSGINIHQHTAVYVMRKYHATLLSLRLGHAKSSHGNGVARLSDVPWTCLACLELCSKKLAAADAATLAKSTCHN